MTQAKTEKILGEILAYLMMIHVAIKNDKTNLQSLREDVSETVEDIAHEVRCTSPSCACKGAELTYNGDEPVTTCKACDSVLHVPY